MAVAEPYNTSNSFSREFKVNHTDAGTLALGDQIDASTNYLEVE